MFQRIRTLIFGRGKGASTKAPGKYLQPIVDHGPEYEYPPVWRKEWDRKHAERNAAQLAAATMDPIDVLSDSLKAAGIHPSQITLPPPEFSHYRHGPRGHCRYHSQTQARNICSLAG